MTVDIGLVVSTAIAVISPSGTGVGQGGLFLTQNDNLPAQGATAFYSAQEVADYFGDGAEKDCAAVYFKGINNALQKPAKLYAAHYADSDKPAWLRGGKITLTLAELKAACGSGSKISVLVNGVANESTFSLSAVASFSAAATAIQSGFATPNQVTVTWDSAFGAFKIATVASGANKTLSFATGSKSETLNLTSGTGATLSQGVAASTPASAMDNANLAQGWFAFFTAFDPDIDDQKAFADWCGAQGDRFMYVAHDSDAANYGDLSGTLTEYLKGNDQGGTYVIFGNMKHAAFEAAKAACVNWAVPNCRIAFAHRSQAGLEPSVVDNTIAAKLKANGVNFYAKFGFNNTVENRTFPGVMAAGKFPDPDSYYSAIKITSYGQQAVFSLFGNAQSVPNNSDGINLILAAMNDVTGFGLTSGVIRKNVVISDEEKAAIVAMVGLDVSGKIYNEGFYLFTPPLTPEQRQAQTAQPIILLYSDGQGIRAASLTSVVIL